MEKVRQLSVFFPAYNEEANIGKTVTQAADVLGKVAENWEILVVDDGSQDKTRQIVERLTKEDKRIKVITHKVNRGYGGALKTGFNNTKYLWVTFSDSDGQFDFSEITKFIKKQRETKADLVLGIRTQRADSFIRKVYTFVWTYLLPRLLFGLKVRDYSCGFKLIKKKVYDKVQPLIGEEKVTQIEMLVKAQRAGFKFSEVTVQHYPRRFGRQTGADVKVVAKSIMDLFKLWRKLR